MNIDENYLFALIPLLFFGFFFYSFYKVIKFMKSMIPLLLQAGLSPGAQIDWPEAEAVISQSYVKKTRERSDNGKYVDTYSPVIEVEYKVDGEVLRTTPSSQININHKKFADLIIKKFPAGKKVKIKYNPDDKRNVFLASNLSAY